MFNQKNKGTNRGVCINYSEIPCEGIPMEQLLRTFPIEYLHRHIDGWDVSGVIQDEGYDSWLITIDATNRKTGEWVYGDFTGLVYASSFETLQRFLCLYPYDEWDGWEI